jgi:hypothetical protein
MKKKIVVIGIIGMFLLTGIISSGTGVKETVKNDDYSLDLSCDNSYEDVKQGETASFTVEITNTGTLDDTYDVIVGSIEDIVCKVNGVNADQFDPYPFSLQSGESETFEVTAEVWESVPIREWLVIVEAHSQNDTEVFDELVLTVNVIGTRPPKPQRPSGPQSGKVGEEYEYWIIASVDPDGDDFSYLFSWGDGTCSEWLGPAPGGENVSASHTWTKKGFYEVEVKAKDEIGVESPWSDPLMVTITKGKSRIISTPFLKFLQQHPYLFPLLQKILLLQR